MKRGIWTILLLTIALVSLSFLGELSGAASYGGYPQGANYAVRSESETTTIEVIPPIIGPNGELIVPAGQTVYFTISVGYKGIRKDSVAFRSAINFAKKDSIRDICSNNYCADDNENLCKPGPKCFEDREGSFKIPEDRRPAAYVITLCEDIPNCDDRIVSPVFFVIEPVDERKTYEVFRGETNPFLS